VLLISAYLAEGDIELALSRARDAESIYPPSPTWHYLIGKMYTEQELWDEARRAYESGLALDEEYPQLHNGMARVLLHQRDHEQAAEHALRAVGLLYFFPEAHYHLGSALLGIGQSAQAVLALQTAVAMEPHMAAAHWKLADLFEQKNDLANSLKHRSLAMGYDSPFKLI
jgi:tetratricopeptide (TPR) repeat protein